MLTLDSPEWTRLKASPGGDGALTASLLRQAVEGDEEAIGELYQQVCHQNSVGEVAYFAAPHIVEIARTAAPEIRVAMLTLLAAVEASRRCYPSDAASIPGEAKADYEAAVNAARKLTAESLSDTAWSQESSWSLIYAMAAFHGHADLALLLQDGPEMSCPSCGEQIEFGEA